MNARRLIAYSALASGFAVLFAVGLVLWAAQVAIGAAIARWLGWL